ncbi:MAG: UPF0147 family protein [Candidatus Parvarchaeota archaeon]|nr:UPF0147 family protein [Candidatus Jingweiarchaeum tengchongense]MCW1298309.1 UPF0147 family protein [Candidatus Jingweiarchaeum tengchongense]MCW1300400.1 UPF0147 family protein [Candidatus Jingweiarchaeum tengchongense]MCW1304755.1 UPF0147 family protein [Candidatus Jingweiarchaeum tengchongense]MCW1305345.1 UPF0147 family protein [Candidatus Jingweiarchaeum tengchongense]
MNQIEQAIALLTRITEDKTVPRNIREIASKAKQTLNDKTKELNVRIDTVIQLFDEVNDDPNMPLYTRTQIWNVISLLESIR